MGRDTIYFTLINDVLSLMRIALNRLANIVRCRDVDLPGSPCAGHPGMWQMAHIIKKLKRHGAFVSPPAIRLTVTSCEAFVWTPHLIYDSFNILKTILFH
jgi:hypothetical protein